MEKRCHSRMMLGQFWPSMRTSFVAVTKPGDLFFSMVSLADNAEILYLEAGRGQLFYGCVRSLVVGEDGDDCVSCLHLILFQCCKFE